jgi:hypothetical protein
MILSWLLSGRILDKMMICNMMMNRIMWVTMMTLVHPYGTMDSKKRNWRNRIILFAYFFIFLKVTLIGSFWQVWPKEQDDDHGSDNRSKTTDAA